VDAFKVAEEEKSNLFYSKEVRHISSGTVKRQCVEDILIQIGGRKGGKTKLADEQFTASKAHGIVPGTPYITIPPPPPHPTYQIDRWPALV